MMIDQNLDSSVQNRSDCQDQHFYANGKLLLSGEYFVLDGAESLALPLRFGQGLSVTYKNSFSPKLYWKSCDVNGEVWFEGEFEFWHFKPISSTNNIVANDLGAILREARKQNNHFLRDEIDVSVETKLGFPLNWGLGSSSSLIYNIAQWANILPFDLLFNTIGGSGFDIACANAKGPISYQKTSAGPLIKSSNFNPTFKEQLYFVYLGKKQDSRQAIEHYKKKNIKDKEVSGQITKLTQQFEKVKTLSEMEALMKSHEILVSSKLGLTSVRSLYFEDYWGEVKSLGAWGGDFIIATSEKTQEQTTRYFKEKGFDICLSYDELVLPSTIGNNEYLH
ncbi:MAG: GHMP kinase [Bdellovibrionales bacterium]|jgi:mevalonate kinase|nr:GHMP kinase [Bdellovibrionales bacterium]